MKKLATLFRAFLVIVVVASFLCGVIPFMHPTTVYATSNVYKVANQDTNFTTAAGWDSVTNIPTLHASTNITIGTSTYYSATFTAPNTTNASTGCLVYLSAVGTGGTITVSLQEYNGAAWVDKGASGAKAVIAVTDLTNYYLNSWLYFRWTTPYVFTTTTASYYRIAATNALATGTTSFRADSGASNFAYLATNDIHAVPAATDNIFISGYNRTNTITVTVSGNQTIGGDLSTEAGTISSLNNAVSVSADGAITWDNTVSSTLNCTGNFVIGNKGSWIMSSPTDNTKVQTLNMIQPVATGDHGIVIEAYPTSVSLQGIPKSSTTLWKTTYSSGVGTVGSPLITADPVDWLQGDEIIVAATSDNATNYGETENMTIATKNSASSYVLTSINQAFTSGFEDLGTTTNSFNYWATSSATLITWETVSVHSGTYAAKVARTTTTQNLYETIANTSSKACVIPNTLVNFSFWTRGDGTNAGSYRIYDVTNAVDIIASTPTGVTGVVYSQVTGSFTIPATCYSYRVYFYSPAVNASSAYFDDLSLTYAGLAATPNTNAYIVNVSRNVVITSNMNSRATYLNSLNRTVGAVNIDWVNFKWFGVATPAVKYGIALGSVSSTVGSGGTTTVSGTSVLNTYNCDYSVSYQSRYYGFYFSSSSQVLTMNGLISCNGQSGSSIQIEIFTRNQTFNDCFVLKNNSYGMRLAGYSNTFNRDIAVSCNLGRGTSTAGFLSSTGGGSNITVMGCESHASGTGIRIAGSDSGIWSNFLVGTKGKNDLQDIYCETGYQNNALFSSCMFGSNTLITGYLNGLDGSLIKFDRLNNTNDKHRWYTNYGSGWSTGAALTDTTVRTAGSLALRMSPEDDTTGFQWGFQVLAKANTAVSATGFLEKNAAFGSDSVTVDLYLPNSITPDYTWTYPAGTGTWTPFNVYANYAGLQDLYATVIITAKTITPNAHLYVDDLFNGSNKIVALDVWYAGMPSGVMFEQLGDASAVWQVSTSTQVIPGTMGYELNQIYANLNSLIIDVFNVSVIVNALNTKVDTLQGDVTTIVNTTNSSNNTIMGGQDMIFIVGIVLLVLTLTVLAFVYRKPILHSAALLGWMIMTWIMVTQANIQYSGTYIPTACGLFGMAMVIIETVSILGPYLSDRKSSQERYEERQNAFKLRLYNMNRRKPKNWWE